MRTITLTCIGLCALVVIGGTGCAITPSSRYAKPLAATITPGTDLRRYEIATVLTFAVTDSKYADPSVGAKLGNDIRERLAYDFGAQFKEVRKGPPLGTENEMVISGTITKYDPGSKVARGILAGLGAAVLEGEMIVTQGNDQKLLMRVPYSNVWAWGGTVGASIGIEEMMANFSASEAATIAHARGWTLK